MTRSWGSLPQFKLEAGGETFINDQAVTIQLVRPENNVSFIVLSVNDYKSTSFVDVFDALATLTLSLRYGSDAWTKVFSGVIETVKPSLNKDGELLEVSAWGKGHPTVKTHCNTSYGLESENPTMESPKEIFEDLVDNYINKSFGGDATGYSLTKTEIEDVHNALDITNITSPYLDNFTVINRVCDVTNAYAQGLGTPEVSIHWYVDPSANLYVKKIDASHTKVDASATDWPRYWGGSQAASTIIVKEDMILYDFRKNVEEYANKIVLLSNLRKPGYDFWTNNQSGLWGHTATHIALTDEATVKIVGSHSLRAESPDSVGGFYWYPSSQDAAWSISSVGSEDTIPSLNFYARRSGTIAAMAVSLHTTYDTDYFNWNFAADLTSADTWYHFSLPIGPYYSRKTEKTEFKWSEGGSPDWSDIDCIEFSLDASSGIYTYVDDLHFTGKFVREAYNSTAITANDEYQRVIRNDIAVNDSLVASDDSGTGAQLAYAELLRRMQTPIVGVIQTPLAVDILPGQTVHIQAAQKSDDTYRIDKDFRVKELRHIIGPAPTGFRTTHNLTDDVTNSHAFAAPTRASVLAKYAGALGHAEARDLKGSGVDLLISRLSKNYA